MKGYCSGIFGIFVFYIEISNVFHKAYSLYMYIRSNAGTFLIVNMFLMNVSVSKYLDIGISKYPEQRRLEIRNFLFSLT